MFKKGYTETVPDIEDGFYHIKAEQWSPGALTVVLNMIHVQIKAISKAVNPTSFANILVVADYYQTEDVLALYTSADESANWTRHRKCVTVQKGRPCVPFCIQGIYTVTKCPYTPKRRHS
jgi:hypothetical protein